LADGVVPQAQLLDPVRLKVRFRRLELPEAVTNPQGDVVKPDLILLRRRGIGPDLEQRDVEVVLARKTPSGGRTFLAPPP
jgi:hypothetical protein